MAEFLNRGLFPTTLYSGSNGSKLDNGQLSYAEPVMALEQATQWFASNPMQSSWVGGASYTMTDSARLFHFKLNHGPYTDQATVRLLCRSSADNGADPLSGSLTVTNETNSEVRTTDFTSPKRVNSGAESGGLGFATLVALAIPIATGSYNSQSQNTEITVKIDLSTNNYTGSLNVYALGIFQQRIGRQTLETE